VAYSGDGQTSSAQAPLVGSARGTAGEAGLAVAKQGLTKHDENLCIYAGKNSITDLDAGQLLPSVHKFSDADNIRHRHRYFF
jgi:hypothetical protein